MSVIDVFAENNFGDTRSGGLAGPMGLFVIVVLAIVTVLLIRNMNTRIRRLPERFPGQDGPDGELPGRVASGGTAQGLRSPASASSGVISPGSLSYSPDATTSNLRSQAPGVGISKRFDDGSSEAEPPGGRRGSGDPDS